MSLLWIEAKEIEAAAKPIPTHAENINNARQHNALQVSNGMGWRDKHFHEMTPEEFAAHPMTMWHGSPSGIEGFRTGAHYGIHVGTQEAARQALEARIGRPAEGGWDGTREYGKTLLTYHDHGYGAGPDAVREHHYPTGKATYSDGSQVPMDAKPHIFPVHIVGEMTNTMLSPHDDFKANGLMQGQIKRGTARRGYYYTNDGEDAGSISAVVPNGDHLATHEDFVRHALEHGHHGRPVPQHNLDRYGLGGGQKTASTPEFFHGTVRPLKPGDVVSPASQRPNQRPTFPTETDRDYAYATAQEDDAWHYAEMAHNSHFQPGMRIHPRVYRVRPLGPHEKDPTYDHEHGYSRGNFEGDVRSKHGFEVLHEMPIPEHMGEPEDWR